MKKSLQSYADNLYTDAHLKLKMRHILFKLLFNCGMHVYFKQIKVIKIDTEIGNFLNPKGVYFLLNDIQSAGSCFPWSAYNGE